MANGEASQAHEADARPLEYYARHLEWLLQEDLVILPGGGFELEEQQVARVDGLSMQVQFNEHPPPHFRVIGNGVDASFRISDCGLEAGSVSRRHRKIIQGWHSFHRAELVQAWNDTRPTGATEGRAV